MHGHIHKDFWKVNSSKTDIKFIHSYLFVANVNVLFVNTVPGTVEPRWMFGVSRYYHNRTNHEKYPPLPEKQNKASVVYEVE